MNFLIADTFTDSLARLTSDEQKAVKTTAFDLQINTANPGMQFHKLARTKDKDFWSVRVNRDLRLIVHRSPESLLLCYVDHHDEAYRWAETRRLERHPTTGAAQLVEVRETIREIEVPRYVDAGPPEAEPATQATPRPLFASLNGARGKPRRLSRNRNLCQRWRFGPALPPRAGGVGRRGPLHLGRIQRMTSLS
jgi:mRNA-degrading endonuclease RelE of RelBE toxin-antitoxin system